MPLIVLVGRKKKLRQFGFELICTPGKQRYYMKRFRSEH